MIKLIVYPTEDDEYVLVYKGTPRTKTLGRIPIDISPIPDLVDYDYVVWKSGYLPAQQLQRYVIELVTSNDTFSPHTNLKTRREYLIFNRKLYKLYPLDICTNLPFKQAIQWISYMESNKGKVPFLIPVSQKELRFREQAGNPTFSMKGGDEDDYRYRWLRRYGHLGYSFVIEPVEETAEVDPDRSRSSGSLESEQDSCSAPVYWEV